MLVEIIVHMEVKYYSNNYQQNLRNVGSEYGIITEIIMHVLISVIITHGPTLQ